MEKANDLRTRAAAGVDGFGGDVHLRCPKSVRDL